MQASPAVPNEKELAKLLNLKTPITALYELPQEQVKQVFPNGIEPSGCVFINQNGKDILKGTPLILLPNSETLCPGFRYIQFQTGPLKAEDIQTTLCRNEGSLPSIEAAISYLQESPKAKCKAGSCLVIAPYSELLYQYVKTVTFWVNSDQLTALIGASKYYEPNEKPSNLEIGKFTNCMSLYGLPLNGPTDEPHGVIGLLDITKRHLIPNHEIVSFNCNVLMFQRLCNVANNQTSVLHRDYIKQLLNH